MPFARAAHAAACVDHSQMALLPCLIQFQPFQTQKLLWILVPYMSMSMWKSWGTSNSESEVIYGGATGGGSLSPGPVLILTKNARCKSFDMSVAFPTLFNVCLIIQHLRQLCRLCFHAFGTLEPKGYALQLQRSDELYLLDIRNEVRPARGICFMSFPPSTPSTISMFCF